MSRTKEPKFPLQCALGVNRDWHQSMPNAEKTRPKGLQSHRIKVTLIGAIAGPRMRIWLQFMCA